MPFLAWRDVLQVLLAELSNGLALRAWQQRNRPFPGRRSDAKAAPGQASGEPAVEECSGGEIEFVIVSNAGFIVMSPMKIRG